MPDLYEYISMFLLYGSNRKTKALYNKLNWIDDIEINYEEGSFMAWCELLNGKTYE